MPGFKTMNIILPALLVLAAAAATYAVPFQKRGLGQVVSQCNHNFAYTFDDGPYEWNTDLVKKFDSVGAKTTFFVNGNNWGCIYSEANVQALRYAFQQGHLIASHTWSHPHLSTLTEAQIDEEIQLLDEALVKILGVKPMLFRPPFGDIDERTSSYIQSKHGKTIVLWDLDSGDTAVGANEAKSIKFYQDLAAEGPNSKHLTLSHEAKKYAVDAAINTTVDALHDAGITLLTVAQCLDTPPYEFVGGFGVRDVTWTCEGTPSAASTGTSTTPSDTSTTSSGTAATSTGTSDTSTGTSDTSTGTSGTSTGTSDTSTSTSSTSSTSTAPSTTPTPACKERYISIAGDDCQKIETKYNLVPGTLKAANGFVTCNDIWTGTPLCITDGPYNSNPTTTTTTSTSTTATTTTTTTTPAPCKQTYTSIPNDTCSSIEDKFNLVAGTVLAANTFLNCNDIWNWTPVCIPDGPYRHTGPSEPSCVTQRYRSQAGDTCSSIETKFALQAGSVAPANAWVNCADIWTGTNLSICVPTLAAADPQTCTKRATAPAPTTCAAVGAANGVSAAWIRAWNPWVNCADIWQGTDLCVAH